jgi:predicted ATPase/class 3 adenylate cyclase
MEELPSGTVTFLFTDIVGSTRRWEADPEGMRRALADHDEVVRSAVEHDGGIVFKHTGDGLCSAFSSASDAVRAAVAAQRRLQLPVRMGMATGSAERQDGDYFGPVLNRTARVMAAGHGGQILLSSSTAGLIDRIDGIDLVDLGRHRLRDLSGAERLFQVRGMGLGESFPPLRTLDAVPGNLPVATTSFVGRQHEVEALSDLVRTHRLVTVTGVGGAGKTRLALEVARGLVRDFPDGVWLVELAAVGDSTAVADVVATTLGITAQPGLSMIESIASPLVDRRMLVVLDNCEHVVDAAADLVEKVMVHTRGVKILATSREALRLGAEHVWRTPPLTVDGQASEAVMLFADRASAVNAEFSLEDPAEASAIEVICRRLDGIPLAIELAAARMISMSAQDVHDRLDDRFRLLAGGLRGLQRHQTLHQAVAWSYDLLTQSERFVLDRGAVFTGGFDLAAIANLCQPMEEYVVLDLLHSLVAKSLITVDRGQAHARYQMLETIRQFGEEQLGATEDVIAVKDAHARYYASQAEAMWALWDGPHMRDTLIWADLEFANLRAGFRWAADRDDLVTATAIAAHTSLFGWFLFRREAVGWAEELLDAAAAGQVRLLPRLYTAASICLYLGRPEDAIGYATTALTLEADPRYEGFQAGLSRLFEGVAYVYAGRIEPCLAIFVEMAADTEPGFMRTAGQTCLAWVLPAAGRAKETRMMADETLAMARAHGNPFLIALALTGYGRASAETDPTRALAVYRQGLEYCREHRLAFQERVIARDAAGLEALHRLPDEGAELFDTTLDAYLRAGDHPSLAITIANLAVFFDRLHQPVTAATLYGASTRHASIATVPGLPTVVERLGAVLGADAFNTCVASGKAMEPREAVAYAHREIGIFRQASEAKTSLIME